MFFGSDYVCNQNSIHAKNERKRLSREEGKIVGSIKCGVQHIFTWASPNLSVCLFDVDIQFSSSFLGQEAAIIHLTQKNELEQESYVENGQKKDNML